MVSIIGYVLLIFGVYGNDDLIPIETTSLTFSGNVFHPVSTEYWDPLRVIDGINSTDAETCKCCSAIARPAWIAIDLKQPYPLTRIEVLGRTGKDTEQSANIQLCVGLFPGHSCDVLQTPNLEGSINPTRLVQYINVSSLESAWLMTICEIKVYRLKVLNLIQTPGLNIHTYQESTFDHCSASHAIDGQFSSMYSGDTDVCSKCSATNGSKVPWWEINFGQQVMANFITIFGRLNAFEEQSRDLLVYTNAAPPTNDNYSLAITVKDWKLKNGQLLYLGNTTFQYLSIRRWYPSVLTICEVIIYKNECRDGTFGNTCQPCGHCTKPTICNKTTGFCPDGCERGWINNDCKTACPNGKYGVNCTETCSATCFNRDNCLKTNGSCVDGCAAGFDYNVSQLCDRKCSGSFGLNCGYPCQCKNATEQCDYLTGSCLSECFEGWTGSNCSVDVNIIPSGKYVVDVSQTSTFSTCFANNAINGKVGRLNMTDADLCTECSATSGNEDPWWQIQFDKPILGNSVRVFGRKDHLEQSQILLVYVNNETYSDNNGSFVGLISMSNAIGGETLSLNKRLFQYLQIGRWNRSVMTICEVKLFSAECDIGRFGDQCGLQCNCRDGQHCDIVTGKCNHTGCKDGWKGQACDQTCDYHHYGSNCNSTCHCHGNDDCNKSTGDCPGICDKGWKENSCSKTCNPGYFGDNCSSQCHCENDEVCHHVFGNCSNNRCAAGWKGDNCSNECEQGLYGINCSSECHCQDGVNCDHVLGYCSDKLCAPGWLSDDCSRECEHDSYGMNCTATCHCQHGVKCDHVHGNCSDHQCAAGWTSYNCSQECEDGFYGINCITECHCQHADLCDHVHGNCTDKKCAAGWIMENCSKAHTFPTVSDKDSTGVPISAFVAVVVFLAIAVGCNIVLATLYIKQRRKRQSGTENNTIVTSPSSLRSDEYDTISPRFQETNAYEGLQMETRTYYND